MRYVLQGAGHARPKGVAGAFHAVFAGIGPDRHVALTFPGARGRFAAAFVGK
jgi:hypothetical protein